MARLLVGRERPKVPDGEPDCSLFAGGPRSGARCRVQKTEYCGPVWRGKALNDGRNSAARRRSPGTAALEACELSRERRESLRRSAHMRAARARLPRAGAIRRADASVSRSSDDFAENACRPACFDGRGWFRTTVLSRVKQGVASTAGHRNTCKSAQTGKHSVGRQGGCARGRSYGAWSGPRSRTCAGGASTASGSAARMKMSRAAGHRHGGGAALAFAVGVVDPRAKRRIWG
jgi:hypothetical protein